MDSRLTRSISFVKTPAVMVALVALCFGLYFFRVHSLYLNSQPDVTLTERPFNTSSITSQSTSALFSAKQIAALNLMGVEKAEEHAAPVVEDIPLTRLTLVLEGAFTSEQEEGSSALISENRRNSSARYFVGDELPGHAILYEVHANHVVLKRGGRLEKLLFPREQQDSLKMQAYEPSARQTVSKTITPNSIHTKNTSVESLQNRLQNLRNKMQRVED